MIQKLDSKVCKEQKLCLHWRLCDRSQVSKMSAAPGLAALHATAVTALAARNSGV